MPCGPSKACPTNRKVPTRHHRNLLQFPTHTHTHTHTHTEDTQGLID